MCDKSRHAATACAAINASVKWDVQGRGWRSEKIRRSRAVVAPVVEELSEELATANPGLEFWFGGSWRRGAETIGDLDILIVNASGTLQADLLDPGVALPTTVRWQRIGPRIANGEIAL